jgi:hypothetical protein
MGSHSPPSEDFDFPTLRRVQPITFENLHKQITLNELDTVIAQLPTNKAPDPDGFTSEFYKTLKNLIVTYLLPIYNIVRQEEGTLAPLNDSFIVLIPKKANAQTSGDYKSISLVNMAQKIFSKIMANKMKNVLTHVVSDTQMGFVSRRNIKKSNHTT